MIGVVGAGALSSRALIHAGSRPNGGRTGYAALIPVLSFLAISSRLLGRLEVGGIVAGTTCCRNNVRPKAISDRN